MEAHRTTGAAELCHLDSSRQSFTERRQSDIVIKLMCLEIRIGGTTGSVGALEGLCPYGFGPSAHTAFCLEL